MIKVHLILGFLGAGKTTFLKKVLKNPALKRERIMLVVNDYGHENYDGQELQTAGIELMEITNGCLCCSNKNQFEEALILCATNKDLDRVFIEPSGLFFPDQVMATFENEPIKHAMQLEPIVTIVDYALFSSRKLWPPAMERLIEAGQLVVRNKIEMVSRVDRHLVDSRIRQLNSHILYDFKEAVNKLFDFNGEHVKTYNQKEIEMANHEVNYIQLIEGLEFRDQSALLSFLTDQTPSVVRAKGHVLLEGQLKYVNYVENDLNVQPSYADARIGLSCFMEKK